MHIAIVGAGIMGRMLGWQLSRAGQKISVFDRDGNESGRAAAHTAAGMLTPYAELESAEPLIFDLGMRSLEIWPHIVSELGVEQAYFRQGSLVVAHGKDRADYQRFKSHLGSKLSAERLASAEIDQTALHQLEPELADQFQRALSFPDEAWLKPQRIMSALYTESVRAGCHWHSHTEATEVSPYYIVNEQGAQSFDLVIDCRGLGAKADMKDLRGVRGELIWLQAPDVHISRLVRLIHPRYGLYLVPQQEKNLYIIGATQIECDDSGPITLRSMLELLSAAYSIHPGFSEARVLHSKTNCRPALADNLPRIHIEAGLIRVNGLFRHGYLLAPALAEEVLGKIDLLNEQSQIA